MMHPAGVRVLRGCAGRQRGGRTHFADDLAQQEKVQLAEDEENRGQDVVPHRADLVEHHEHDVRHNGHVEDRSAARAGAGVGTEKRTIGGERDSRARPDAREDKKRDRIEVCEGI